MASTPRVPSLALADDLEPSPRRRAACAAARARAARRRRSGRGSSRAVCWSVMRRGSGLVGARRRRAEGKLDPDREARGRLRRTRALCAVRREHSSRARVFERPTPVCSRRARRRAGRRRCRGLPARAGRRRAGERDLRPCPGPLRGATPCLIAFSTSGCRIRRGTSASSVSGSMSNLTVRRSWKRVCSISRYFCRNSSSSCSETLGAPERSNVMRSRSLSRLIIRSAESGCVWTSVEIACSVLNRKCGCSSASSVFSRASTRRASRCAALTARVLRLVVIRERVAQPDDRGIHHQRPVEVRQELRCANVIHCRAAEA